MHDYYDEEDNENEDDNNDDDEEDNVAEITRNYFPLCGDNKEFFPA